MKWIATALISAAICPISHAAERSGQAAADWISATAHVDPGKPLQTGIRLTVDQGWHTYWSNPGEGGMRISVKWKLPDGWTAGEIQHPAPIRFTTGGLPGFGYVGTVVFPVALTPPAGFSGKAELKAEVSWLTCDDEKCVPGNASLVLLVTAGEAAEGGDAATLAEALGKIPVALGDAAKLEVAEKGESLVLTLSTTADALRPQDCVVFPETPQVVDAAAEINFQKSGGGWTAEVPKSEYATGKIRELTLVFAPKAAGLARSATWRAE